VNLCGWLRILTAEGTPQGRNEAASQVRTQVAAWASGYVRRHAPCSVDDDDVSEALQHLLMRYTLALFTQMSQTAVCNRHHTVDQQLCRWLLLSFDRLSGNELYMTQDLIANMLGVRREGVTEAAGKLQKAGLIRYRRGKITILDRPGLEARVCECYEVVKKEFNRLLPDVIAV